MDLPVPKIPGATYRLQFNRHFTFRDAARIIPYLHDLGITDIYASPYFKAKQGSMHGYDIVDHNSFNPEIGTEDDYQAMVAELNRHGMGQLLDIVPNHMCIEDPDNRWWTDLLENGQSSPYAKYFDIDWSPVKKELLNKVLIPILGDQYGRALEAPDLTISFEEGAFFLYYYEHKFPVQPQTYVLILEHHLHVLEAALQNDNPDLVEFLSVITALKHLPSSFERDREKIEERYREKKVIKRRLSTLYSSSREIKAHIDKNVRLFNGTKGDPKSFDLLDGLMNQQVYRLSHWRVATDEINYRRFFDINGLAAIRMEHPGVFEATHELIFRLIRDKSVTGLRVDHPDGLYDPDDYFHRLQEGCFVQIVKAAKYAFAGGGPNGNGTPGEERELAKQYRAALQQDPEYKPFYIVGEKILTRSERMPREWPIFSTTGYVFLNSVNGIFIDGENAKAFELIYQKFIRSRLNFQDVFYEKKKLVMQVAMSSEVNTLGRYLNDISEKNRHTRDFTLYSLRSAIVDVIASFPVYRTYINSCHVTDRDSQYIELAVSKAKRRNPAISESIFDFLKDILLVRCPKDFKDEDKAKWVDFVMRFQQITGPVMAKGLEDTAFYVYNRLVSLNEVGGMPDRFGTPLETFHGQNMERVKNWPHALITTSTHDTKRSEDVRMRINVLSEMPVEWAEHLKKWAKLNKKKKISIESVPAPDLNEEYLLYQTLVGVWPVVMPAGRFYGDLIGRIKEYMVKALREAKLNTSWTNQNKAYEDAVIAFIETVLRPSAENPFLNDFLPFQRSVSHYAMFYSLSQALLKTTCPGVPDFYQGRELWDFSLVDPDNRRPVDYDKREHMLSGLKELAARKSGTELCRELTVSKDDGRIMLYLIWKALNFRRANRRLFLEGGYAMLEAAGARGRSVCAFERKIERESAFIIVPRLLARYRGWQYLGPVRKGCMAGHAPRSGC